jgi:hypothetical protein|tara:strand:+ start:85 stop:219 length:135 start_codon:yes stop_codon:yes gene_type:complete
MKYLVKIHEFADEVYTDCNVNDILEIVETFTNINNIISIEKITK